MWAGKGVSVCMLNSQAEQKWEDIIQNVWIDIPVFARFRIQGKIPDGFQTPHFFGVIGRADVDGIAHIELCGRPHSIDFGVKNVVYVRHVCITPLPPNLCVWSKNVML
jgi:hypothetical protein